MKKTFLILCFSMLVCAFDAMSQQTLSPSPATVQHNGTVTLTAVGETIFRNLKGNISFNDLGIVTNPNGYRIFLQIKELKRIQEYDFHYSKPSKFSFKIENSTSEDIVVTIPFQCVIQSLYPGQIEVVNSNYITPVTFTVTPTPPTTFTNDARSQTFYKSNCGTGYESDPYVYTVPAGEFTQPTKAAANALADAKIAQYGQSTADANLTCKQVYYNTVISVTKKKNDCQSGYEGTDVTYVVNAGKHKSFVSQADADQKAASDLSSNGQQYANTAGGCAEWGSLRYINGVQEVGIRKCTLSKPALSSPGYFDNTYHYVWSDGSRSHLDYYETVLYQCTAEIEP